MKKTKLVQLLSTITPEEMKKLEKFLISPYFSCGKFELNFFLAIKKYYPDFDVSREVLFRKIYKNKIYDDRLIRKSVSNLSKHLEEFLIIENNKRFDSFRDFSIMNELLIRKSYDLFELRSKEIYKKYYRQNNLETGDFLEKWLYHSQMINYKIDTNRMGSAQDNIREHEYNILFMFLFSINITLHYHHTLKTTQNIEIESITRDKFLKFFDYKGFINSAEDIEPLYKKYFEILYHKLILTQNSNASESYDIIKTIVLDAGSPLAPVSRWNIASFLENYLLDKIRKGESSSIAEYLSIARFCLKEELFLIFGSQISVNYFCNIVRNSILNNEVEWAKNFISGYSKYLLKNQRENVLNYCNAMISFAENRFEQSLEFISKTEFERLSFKRELKLLKIKCYYELGHIENIHAEIDSLRHLISNSGFLLEEIVTSGKNFMNYFKRFLKLLESENKEEILYLKSQIEKEQLVQEKAWLLEKIQTELRKS